MKIGSLDIRVPKPTPISQAPRSRKIALGVVACIALFFLAKPMALLLWARIRILTSLPKTAIAEPVDSAGATPNVVKDLDPNLPSWRADVPDPVRVNPQVFPDPKAAGAGNERREGQREQAVAPQHEAVDGAPALADGGEAATGESGDSEAPAVYESLRAAAESVRVQSAGAGLQGAVIDDKAVRIGETVRTAEGVEFTLVAVLDGAVVLGIEGREFTVQMPKLPASAPIRPTPKPGGGQP
jgi:hypothetical protein